MAFHADELQQIAPDVGDRLPIHDSGLDFQQACDDLAVHHSDGDLRGIRREAQALNRQQSKMHRSEQRRWDIDSRVEQWPSSLGDKLTLVPNALHLELL